MGNAKPQPNDISANKLSTPVIIAGVFMFIIVGTMVAAPRGTPILLPLLGLLFLAGRYAERTARPAFSISPLVGALVLFGIYLLINSSWSVVPKLAYGKVAIYFLIVSIITIAAQALKVANRDFIERLSLNLILAALTFAFYLVVEVWFGEPIRKAVLTLFPGLLTSTKHVVIKDGAIAHIGAYTLNRSVAVLCLVLWPALLASVTLWGRNLSLLAGAALLSATFMATLYSQHETSILSLGFSAAIFVLAWHVPRLALWTAATGWIIATMLVVPIAFAAYAQNLHLSSSIPATGRARIILWDFTAEQVLNQPVLGVGVQSTKPIDEARTDKIEKPGGFNYPRRTSRHAHNIYLQTWYELGAIGALLLGVCGLALLHRLSTFDPRIRPYALATFICAAVTGAFSWGMWQPWFMAAFGMSALLAILAIELAQRRQSASGPAAPS